MSLDSSESIPLSPKLFAQLDLDIDRVPLDKLAEYNAVYYFLMLEDEPPEEAPNLEKVRRYLEAYSNPK